MSGNNVTVIDEYALPMETWKELALEAYNTGRRHERIARMKKRKKIMESVKLALCFGGIAIGMPLLMILHYLVIGY